MTANRDYDPCLTWRHSQLCVLQISLFALRMKPVTSQSGLILSDLQCLVSMGGDRHEVEVKYRLIAWFV